MPNSIYKEINEDERISTRQEQITFTGMNGSELVFTLCDRTQTTSTEANYFSSFNLPYEYNALPSGSTLATQYPEIYQLNRDKIVIMPIPKQSYSELIDGRSITMNVPQFSGTTGISAKTIYSSTYTTLTKTDNNPILGGNIAFLFSDEINKPYTGETNNGQFSNVGNTTWGVGLNYTNRPAAVSYSDLAFMDLNSDTRPWSAVSLANVVPEEYPAPTNQGYNYDIPLGFVALDKGFIIFTHPSIVDNIPWPLGQSETTAIPNTTSGTTNICFSAAPTSNISYIDISINYKTTVVCVAMPNEFYFSNNPTWDFLYNYNELLTTNNAFESVFVTEVGLYNRISELVAVAKLSQPLEKTYTNIINFTLNIDV
jgi:hypothetical protein